MGSPSTQIQGGYTGRNPKCNRCGYHHVGGCDTFRCNRCHRNGHLAKDCRTNIQPGQVQAVDPTSAPRGNQGCFNCGETGYFKRNCPKLNKGEASTARDGGNNKGGGAAARVYVIAAKEDQEDPDTVTRTYFLSYLSLHFGFTFIHMEMLLGRYRWVSYTDHSSLQ